MGSAPYLGHAGIEAEAIDSVTLHPVCGYVEERFPKKYDIDTTEGVGKAVIYTKDAFDYWAKKFRARLDEINAKTKAEEKTWHVLHKR
jgi:Protein of unknown function (DUF3313)